MPACHTVLWRRVRWCRTVVLVCVAACAAPIEGVRNGAGARAYLQAEEACNVVGVIEVVIRARWVGCPDASPCVAPQAPQRLGTRVTCPSVVSEVLAEVDGLQAGRWVVEALSRYTTGETATQCFSTETSAVFEVTAQDVEDHAVVDLEPSRSACPDEV